MLRFSPNPNRAHLIPWRELSAEAFRAARQQDKPVMLFLSAFWCRYCQRMDEEAFSETENIALLNAYFISLRVENAQRPDVDARYNLNGWPTIAFMTPQGQLLAAVNYLPTEQFKNVLIDIYIGYQERKSELSSLGKTGDVHPDRSRRQISDELLAANLTAITDTIMGLADRVTHQVGNAVELPFGNGTFDLVWTQNSGMNIAAKEQLYAGFHRVLRLEDGRLRGG